MEQSALALSVKEDAKEGVKEEPSEGTAKRRKIAASGSVLGAIVSSACCILPLVFFSLGISGAWIGNLTALYPYKPIFVTITLAFLAAGFYMVYRKPKAACEPGSYCAAPAAGRLIKIALWGSTVLIAAVLIFPYLVPIFLKT